MIQSAEIIKQMLSGKRSMIRVPVKTKLCPYKIGKAYPVRASGKEPLTEKTLRITITDVRQELHDDRLMWVIRFQQGDRRDLDRLPAARFGPGGDYVASNARALQGTASEVSERQQARFAAKSEETYAEVLIDRQKRLGAVLREMRIQRRPNRDLREAQRRASLTNGTDRLF